MTTKKLVVLGSINVDHIMNLHQFPQPGETVVSQGYQIAFGGKGANQAVAAGRSGANVSFLACVGEDELGQQICQQLSQDNIDILALESINGMKTGVAMIFVNSDGENVIAINVGANAAVTPDYLARYSTTIADSSVLLMQLESPLDTVIAAAKLAKIHQTKVVLNPAPAQALPDELLNCVDIISPNETEAEHLTGIKVTDDASAQHAAEVLHSKGITTVLITLGARGVWLSEKGLIGQRIAGFKVNAIDTIAAGDTFNGAMMTALLEGQPIVDAIRFAHGAAAIAVTRIGAQPSVPWREEIEQFLKENT